MSKQWKEESDEELKRQLEAIETGEYEEWLKKEAEANEWDQEEHLGSGETSDEKEDNESDDDVIYNYPRPNQPQQKSKSKAKISKDTGASQRSSEGEAETLKDAKDASTWEETRDAEDAILFLINKEKSEEERPWKFLCATELEERRKTLADLDHQLKIQCMAYKEKKHAMNKRWEKAYAKQHTLINLLRKFEQVKSDCKEKRRRANAVYFAEKAETEKLLKILKDGEQELNHLSHLLVKCQERLEKNKIFKDFMKEIQDESGGEFKTIRQIPDRAQMLQTARQRLVDWNSQNHADIRTAIQGLYQANQTSRQNILRQSSILSGLLKINRIVENELVTLEQQLDVTHMRTRNQSTVIGQIQLSISNLYIELSKRLGLQPTIPWKDPVGQLKSIASFMKQLKNLYKDIRMNAHAGSDNVAIEVDTQALLKERLKYKL